MNTKNFFYKTAITFSLLGAFLFANNLFANGKCKEDRKKFCAAVQEEGVFQCLVQNYSNLSEECKSHVDKVQAVWKELQTECKEDLEKHCAGMMPGTGKVRKCLMNNKDKLTEKCKTYVESMRKMKKVKV